MSNSPVVVGFLVQDYHYKLVAIHIPHDAGWASIRSIENRIWDMRPDRNSAPAPQRRTYFLKYNFLKAKGSKDPTYEMFFLVKTSIDFYGNKKIIKRAHTF